MHTLILSMANKTGDSQFKSDPSNCTTELRKERLGFNC